jgi:hypothetical protein
MYEGMTRRCTDRRHPLCPHCPWVHRPHRTRTAHPYRSRRPRPAGFTNALRWQAPMLSAATVACRAVVVVPPDSPWPLTPGTAGRRLVHAAAPPAPSAVRAGSPGRARVAACA